MILEGWKSKDEVPLWIRGRCSEYSESGLPVFLVQEHFQTLEIWQSHEIVHILISLDLMSHVGELP